ncbi:MAG: hypothetical protein ACLRR3_10040 [Eubacterium sp.]
MIGEREKYNLRYLHQKRKIQMSMGFYVVNAKIDHKSYKNYHLC